MPVAPFRANYDWSNVINPMTDAEAREWVAALRSGKYAQARGKLHIAGRFCCLGVEATLHTVRSDSNYTLKAEDDAETEKFTILRLPEGLQDALVVLNDESKGGSGPYTFPAIADFIAAGFAL